MKIYACLLHLNFIKYRYYNFGSHVTCFYRIYIISIHIICRIKFRPVIKLKCVLHVCIYIYLGNPNRFTTCPPSRGPLITKEGEFKPIYCTVLIETAIQYNFWGSDKNILSSLSYIRIVKKNKMQPNPYARQTDN